jgi:hypothetical protein
MTQSQQTVSQIRSELARAAGRPPASPKMGQALSVAVVRNCDGIAGSYKMDGQEGG